MYILVSVLICTTLNKEIFAVSAKRILVLLCRFLLHSVKIAVDFLSAFQ